MFDASAEFHGTSLNKQLLTGPDLLQELPAILMRFREKAVAIAGDIDQMFHQVRVRKDDRPALSFLWRDMERGRPPDTYEMNVAIFGAKCSPAIASYALRKVIEGHAEANLSKEAAADIVSQFYMDDYVASADCPEKAAELLHTVTRLVSTGGFNLRKWTSNSREVIESVRAADRAHVEMDPSIPLPVERVLGLVWDAEQDTIGIHLPMKRNLPSTKRGVLKAIMAVTTHSVFCLPLPCRQSCSCRICGDNSSPGTGAWTSTIFTDGGAGRKKPTSSHNYESLVATMRLMKK